MNEVNIITGAGDGLGRELSVKLSKSKSDLILISRSKNVYETEKLCKRNNINCLSLKHDISSFNEIFNSLNNIGFSNTFKVNLVFCAGTVGQTGGFSECNYEDWINTYAVNVLGNLNILKYFINNTKAITKSIFIAGGGSAYGYPLLFGYSLSKTALVRAVENISIELDEINKNHITHIIAPGAMKTKMLETVKSTGAEIKTTVPINETVDFIIKLLNRDYNLLNGRFFHVRDNIDDIDLSKDDWLLRRIT